MPRRGLGFAMGAAAVLLAACSTTVQGAPVSVFADPFKVAGMRAVDGPTGLRDSVHREGRSVAESNGGEIDEIAGQSVADIEQFWEGAFPAAFPGRTFRPVDAVISWDAEDYDGVFCGSETYRLVNAAFCPIDNTIGWDRGVLLPALRQVHGDMAITMVLAHEYGHSVQQQARLNRRGTSTLVAEQQADCFSGAYMRWVAEDNSDRFTLSTGDGLNNLLAGMIVFRDPLLTEDDFVYSDDIDEHGSAFERISAFQFGFTDGAAACAAIDAKEVTQRRGELPVALQQGETGEWPVTEDSVRSFIGALNTKFKPSAPPELSFDTDPSTCPDARPSPPASYCPATNTITVDLAGLAEMGSSPTEFDPGAPFSGDNSAYSVLVSRYMLALQHARGNLALDTAEAALRTACLTGVATTILAQRVTAPDGNTIALTAGDLDEAVAGLLSNGLVASDVNGESVPAGFSRIDAFRTGVLGDQARCLKRFP